MKTKTVFVSALVAGAMGALALGCEQPSEMEGIGEEEEGVTQEPTGLENEPVEEQELGE